MFDIGWTEMLVIAVVMIVVVGPKDLPKMLRTFGKMTTKVRGMAGDFQKQFNDALKEAELDEVKKSVDSLRGLNPASEIKKHLNPFEKAAADVRAGLQSAMAPKPSTASQPASPAVHEAAPLKTGAAALPGEGSPPVNGSASLATPPSDLSPAPAVVAVSAAPVAVKGPEMGSGAGPQTAASTVPKPEAAKPAGRQRKPAATAAAKPAGAARAASPKPTAAAAKATTSRAKPSGKTK